MSSTIIGYNKDDIAISSISRTKNEEWLIPIRRDGSTIKYRIRGSKLDLSYEFEDKVIITSVSGNFYLSSLNNKSIYLMFPTEAEYVIKNNTIVNGVFSGRFKFRQRGPKIGIQYLWSI